MRRLPGTILFSLFLAGLALSFSAAVELQRATEQTIKIDLGETRIEPSESKVTAFLIGRQSGEDNEVRVSAYLTLLGLDVTAFGKSPGEVAGDFRLRLTRADSSVIFDGPIEFRGTRLYDDFVNQRAWSDYTFVMQPTLTANSPAIGEPVKGMLFAKAGGSMVTYAINLPSTTVNAYDVSTTPR